MTDDEVSPQQQHRNERLQFAIDHETIDAMKARYAAVGMPIDQEGYIRGTE